MDTTNYFTYAVPVFISAMLIEAGVSALRKKPVYSFSDTFANLACGMGSQLMGLLLTAMTLAAYGFVYDRFRIADLSPSSGWTWVAAILGVDLIYYFWHRLSHTTNIFWASHVVHHQSEEYNLSVALRQSWFGNAFSWIFYLPLAILGVPPLLYLLSGTINLLYQFVIHTKAIKTLGPLDWVLNTPSHHRVHHGSNVEYLDKNYAGIFIIWDLMFGTFVPERAPVEYGLVKPLRSFNPVWANVHYWVELGKASREMKGMNKFLVWFKNPGWQPGDKGLEDARERIPARVYEKHRLTPSPLALLYVFVQFLVAVACTVSVMALGKSMEARHLLLIYGSLLSSMLLWNGLLSHSSFAWRAEAIRTALLIPSVAFVLHAGAPSWSLPLAMGFLGVSVALLAVALLTRSDGGAILPANDRPTPVLAHRRTS